MKITNKRQMYDLYEKGEFGNQFECWKSLQKYWNSGYELPVNFRYRGEGTGKFVHYGIAREYVPRQYCELLLDGYSTKDIHITAGDLGLSGRTVQGEVYLDDDDKIYLLWTDVDEVMRTALSLKSNHAAGFDAWKILNKSMDAKSLDNLKRLFFEYPHHVVEFTCYDHPVGVLGWNTVFWEVRAY